MALPVVVVLGTLGVNSSTTTAGGPRENKYCVYARDILRHSWETPRYVALAADFCAITGVYTTHVRAYCRSTAPASTPSLWMTTMLIIVQFVSLLQVPPQAR